MLDNDPQGYREAIRRADEFYGGPGALDAHLATVLPQSTRRRGRPRLLPGGGRRTRQARDVVAGHAGRPSDAGRPQPILARPGSQGQGGSRRLTDAVSERPVAVRRAEFLIVSVSWPQALAWRMRRQLLEPVGTEVGRGRRAPAGRRPGPVRFRHRARRPDQTPTIPAGRGRSRPGGRADHQDVRLSRRHAPDDARGRGRLPCLAGSQSNVGAPELAELLRPGAIGLAAPS